MSRTKASQLVPGAVYSVTWPFLRRSFTENRRTIYMRGAWKPGAEFSVEGPGDTATWCHGEGSLTVTVVSIHKPGPKFHPRVFYVAQFTDPDGQVMKPRLRVKAAGAFAELLKGYRHKYEIEPVEGPWLEDGSDENTEA